MDSNTPARSTRRSRLAGRAFIRPVLVCLVGAVSLSCNTTPELAIDVQSDVIRISTVATTDPVNQTATIHANATGGSEPYYYVWTVKDPMGQVRNELLDDRGASDPIFHAGTLIGPYLLICTVTDAALHIVTDTTIIYVSQDLGLSLSVDRQEVPNGGGTVGQARVEAEMWGGTAPYAYVWSAVGPDGLAADDRLFGSANAWRVFTSSQDLGTYRIQCRVTDATGAMASETIDLAVSDLLSAIVSADRPVITPGGGSTGQTWLSARVGGGKSPYTYDWLMYGPDGQLGNWLDKTNDSQVRFTSPSEVGTYRAVCTVTDARGQQVVNSVLVLVSQQLGISVGTSRQRVAIDGGLAGRATVSATVLGGALPYTYLWTALDPGGNNANVLLDDIHVAAPVFTSAQQSGTYRFACQVTDGTGQIAVDSLEITVGEQLIAQLMVTSPSGTSASSVNPASEWVPSGGGANGEAAITAEALGGSPPYTYEWTITGPDGQPADDRLTGTTPHTRFFTSANTLGTYRISCKITDITGLAANDSIKIAVYDNLSLDTTIDRMQMPAGGGSFGLAHLHAITAGGTPPITYAWTIIAPDGQTDNQGLNDPTAANPIFTSYSVNGIFRALCKVTDSTGQVVEDSLLFLVGQGVTLDVTCDRTDVLANGGQAHLHAVAHGGIPPYTFEWTATDPLGVTSTTPLQDIQTDSPTFTSALLTGTYTLTCTVTDAAGFVSVLSTSLVVGGGLDQGLSVDVSAARLAVPLSAGKVHLYAAVLGGVPQVTYDWVVRGPSGLVTGTLDDPTAPNPEFTAPATAGTYRFACTVTDSVLKQFTDTVEIYVGMPLALDVSSNRLSLPAQNEQAHLTTHTTGGESPYTYAWSVLDPSGGNATSALGTGGSTQANPTFTAPAAPGSYQFVCTVTDASGATATACLQAYVGMSLFASLSATRQSLPSAQTSTLAAAAYGGTGSYTYAWTATNPSGGSATAQLSSTNAASTTFTAPATAGTYRLTCTVTDTANATFTQTLLIYVGMPLTLDVRTDRLNLPAQNEQASLTASANGGVGTYHYSWTATNPSGSSALASIGGAGPAATATPTFTAPSAPGTYRFTCTVTDDAANTAVASLQITVGMSLWCDLSATKQNLPAGQTSALTVAAFGGTGSYTYTWTATNPSGGSATAQLSPTNAASTTFTAPATAGTYRITCTVTDTANATFTQTALLYVGMPLTLDVITDRLNLPASGQQAHLTASANGGVGTYTYSWTATDPSGASVLATIGGAGPAATATPTFTAPTTPGTYRFTCTVTDSAANTAVASLQVTVGMSLWCDVSAARQSLPSGQTSLLSVTARGGTDSYTYTWTALDPTGANATSTLTGPTTTTPTFTAPAAAGTYRVTCTVTDTANATFTRTLHLYVGMPLTLDVRTDRLSLPAQSQQAHLTASANGGVGTYHYSWTATDPSGASVLASIGGAGPAATATPTFTAPSAPGTYRFTCTVTDDAANTAVASLQITVGMSLWCDLTATRQTLPSAQTTDLTALAQGGTGSYSYAWTALDPTGGDASGQLSPTNAAGTTFTAPATAGTYRITCTVTDTANATFKQSALIYVGMPLTLDVRTDRLSLPAASQQAHLTASANGGVGTYHYSWTALDPSGTSVLASIGGAGPAATATPTFTASATAGTYRFICTVTDGAANTAIASLEVMVGMSLWCDLTATKQNLPSGQSSTLSVDPHGGTGTYTFAWTALDPAGASATSQLSPTNAAITTFTAPTLAGTYRITCTVTDSANATFTRSTMLYVGMPLTLDVRTDRLNLPAASQQAQLTASANGGVGAYTYSWTATDPSGSSVLTSIGGAGPAATATPVFTAPATPGTYRFTCTVTDNAANTAIASLQITVGMGLWFAISATQQSLPSGQTSALTVNPHGGTGTYTYAWTALDPSGASATSQLSPTNAALTTFTAPATAGTYRITCTVTDSANATFTQSVMLYVGMPLTLDVRTDRLSLPATSQQANLTASANGGVGTYHYAWTALDPSGGNALAAIGGAVPAATATPIFTAPGAAGTYRFTCTVTDDAANTAVASLQVMVGMPLWADISATKQSLPATKTSTLTVYPHGGTGSYAYAWSALDPADADATSQLNATNTASVTFTAPATAGTYRVTCTVTDSANATFTQTLLIYVGMALTLDVRTNRLSLPAASEQALLTASANGGVGTYTYAWTATNPSNADAIATIGGAGPAATASPTFTAPGTAGTYRFTCTVADDAGNTATASLQILVGMSLWADISATKQSLPAAKTSTLTIDPHGGTGSYTYAWTALDPANADASSQLDATNTASVIFTAPATAGTYRVTCTVTDTAHATFTQTLLIYVGMPLTLDVYTDRLSLPASGQQAQLTASANGGVGNYAYAWTATDPSGGNALARIGGAGPAATAAPVFTATTTAGTYRLSCTVTDDAGNTAVASLEIMVGMPLWADITATKQTLPAGQTSALTLTAHGGTGSYTYAWTATRAAAGDSDAKLSAPTAATTNFSPDTAGSYRITCTVTDTANATFTQTALIYVGTALTLDLHTDRLNLPVQNEQAQLTASPHGGVGTYSYLWTATDPSGGDALADIGGAGPAATDTPVFTAPATAGTYRFTCTVTDSAGNTCTASLHLTVGTGLWCDISATKQTLPVGQTSDLTLTAHGGIGTYTYAWTATRAAAGDSNARLSSLVAATTTFSPTTAGSYRIACTVTDGANTTFTQTVLIYVGTPLTLDVYTDRVSLPAAGQQAVLTASANGGVGTCSYLWTATDPSGGNALASIGGAVPAATASPTFTAPSAPGTYRFTCTVTDTAGNTAVASLHVTVGMGLWCDISATKQVVAPNQASDLTATATGGTGSYTYAWTALDPSGASATGQLSPTNAAGTTFSALTTAGTYRITCTVTDTANATFKQTVLIYVGMPLTLDVRTNRLQLPAQNETATLTASANGGVGTYTYSWAAYDPSNAAVLASIGGAGPAATASPTFTAPATVGTYRFTCTVTDGAGNTAIASLNILVGMGLWCDITATRQTLPVGQTSTLTADPHGGTGSYTYAWSATRAAAGDSDAKLSAPTAATTNFSPDTAGSYRITCTVTDTAHATFTHTALIYVAAPLNVDVTADYASIPVAAGSTTTIRAAVHGGTSPYTYLWSALNQSGTNSDTAIAATTNATTTFDTTLGTGVYRLTCTVTDAAGFTATDTTTVQAGLPLSAYLLTTHASLPATKTATLTAGVLGGASPYTYTWTVTNPSGSDIAATALSSATASSPTFTAPSTAGAYRVTCTVKDSRLVTATASLQLYVGLPLNVDVSATLSSLPVSQSMTLTATATGGVVATAYTYAWDIRDSAGTDQRVATLGSLAAAATVSPTFSAATAGTYRAKCTVTDDDGYSVSDTVQIQVGMPLSAIVTASKQILVAGDTATLTATPNGGIPSYTYAWTVTDPSGSDITATPTPLSSTTASNPTFTAPTTATLGAYQIKCTVTDSKNFTFTAVVHISVAMNMDTWMNPLAGNATLIYNAQAFTSQYTVLYANSTLNPPRNLVLQFNDASTYMSGTYYFTVDGIGPDGHYQTEYFDFTGAAPPAKTGTKPFAHVDFVRFVRTTSSTVYPGAGDSVTLGTGDILGLTHTLSSTGSVRQVYRHGTTTAVTGWSYVSTPGAQGVDMSGASPALNGTNDYDVYYDAD